MFSAYARVKDKEKTYREIFGLDFEQFKAGQHFRHRPGITITQQDNIEESMETTNFAMLHYDQAYAAKTEWKKCLGVSTLTLQKVLGATWKTFARKKRIISFESINMTAPVYDGDTLYAESIIIHIADNASSRETAILTVETRATNQHNLTVASIIYKLLMYRSGFHPYYAQQPFDYSLSEHRFSAYEIEGNHILKEISGLYYEEFHVGETYEHACSKTIPEHESIRHSLLSLDWNPRYINPSYSKEYLKQRLPVNEVYLVGAITAYSTRSLGRVVANLGWKEIQLTRDVLPGESLQVSSTIMDKRVSNSRPEQGILTVNTKAIDEKGEKVISMLRTLLIYKKGCGPYKEAGY